VPPRDTAPDRLALIRDLLTSLPAAVAYLAGPDLVIDFANDAYCRLAGDRDVADMPLRQVLPELAFRYLLEAFAGACDPAALALVYAFAEAFR